MDDFITTLLNLKESKTLNVEILPSEPSCMVIKLEYPPNAKFCSQCGFRMFSKGTYIRTVKHPVLQDGRQLFLKLHKHKWQCQNQQCKNFESDVFPFAETGRRVTSTTDFLIVNAFRDYNLSVAQIAKRFNVSDTYALTVFDRYVDLPRLKLSEAICFDEVNLNIEKYKYALVIQDFLTGEPIDIVISRRNEITEPYFANIPKEERLKVKYVISDMYAPYQNYVDKYFPNAVPIVDGFHVVKLINQKLLAYMNQLRKKYKARDDKIFEERQKNCNYKLFQRESKELYLLRTKKWLVLANQDSINYEAPPFRDWRFSNSLMYVSDYERALFELDPHLEELRNLKEKYIDFNSKYTDKLDEARLALDLLISEYRSSGYPMFEEFAESLNQYKSAIINSFISVYRTDRKGNRIKSRLSNGPMESLNRIPKDMKRNGRGYLRFSHIRNRFLFAMRNNAPILACPKSPQEVRNHTGKKRGSYKKKSTAGESEKGK